MFSSKKDQSIAVINVEQNENDQDSSKLKIN